MLGFHGPNQLLCNRNKDNRIRNNVYPDTAISHYFANRYDNRMTHAETKNIYECNLCLGSRTLHPEISIINLSDSCMQQTSIKFGVYAIILAEKCEKSHCCCGKGSCDYSYATMIFCLPNRLSAWTRNTRFPRKVICSFFSPTSSTHH